MPENIPRKPSIQVILNFEKIIMGKGFCRFKKLSLLLLALQSALTLLG